MHDLQEVVVKATKAWADYKAYTDDFRIPQKRQRHKTYFHNNRRSVLNIRLQNVTTAFKLAVRRWSEFDAFRHELCAIFPNAEMGLYFELHKDVAQWVHEQNALKIHELTGGN